MYLSSQIGEENALANAEPANLYGSMMTELNEVRKARGRWFFMKLWGFVAPSGNIYRLVALEAERLKHCEDIWAQISELGGGGSTEEMVESIRTAPQSKVSEDGAPGFKPLEEFVSTRTWRLGPLLLPVDSAQCRIRLYGMATAWLVCWLQVTSPLFILMNQASLLPDRLKSFHKIFSTFNFTEIFCLGPSFSGRLHTLMGIALLILLLLILTNYVSGEIEGISKSKYLPLDPFWLFVGNATNIWCTVVTSLAAPVLFWNEATPTSMSMDALTMLWIFTLDDFSSYAFNIMLTSDEDFQRSVAWTKALLSHCPVRLADMCDDRGRLQWRYDDHGIPLKAGTQQACQTRMRDREVSSVGNEWARAVEIERTPGSSSTLPYLQLQIVSHIWGWVHALFYIMQFATPFAWFVVNRPCLKGDQ